MKIAIAGSTGLIGTNLVAMLKNEGHEVVRLVRDDNKEGIKWHPNKGEIDAAQLEGFDVIINLTGENIASGRWTEKKRQRIRDSRVLSTKTLAKALMELKKPPKLWINASAAGYYSSYERRICDESSSRGEGFLSEVCSEWEEATHSVKGVRVVNLRTGMVLTKEGGALKKMLFPFRLGLGGVLGSGKQYMSWIAMDDLLNVVKYTIKNEGISGPVNVTAPHVVTNQEFTKTLGSALWRPTFLWLPEWKIKFLFGEMGVELFLKSSGALPKKLQESGFEFKFNNLKGALKHILN